jgi:phage baseplate assembly protein W
MNSSVVSLPFKFNEFGQVNTTIDSKTMWRDRVLMVLLTRFSERLMIPSFGSDIASTVFENADLASEIATKTISIAFNKWLSSLELKGITPVYDYTTGTLEVTLLYTLPSGETDTVTFNTAIFSRSGDLILELTRG